MTSDQFTYWLQGFVEINGGAPTPQQWLIIKDHLKLVFDKVTPNRLNSDPIYHSPFSPNTSNPYTLLDSGTCKGINTKTHMYC